jgi:methyltransferase FkbM-like protein
MNFFMSFNQYKKRKNKFYNYIKHLLLGKGLRERKILFGKAKGIRMYIDPDYKFQRIIGADEREIQALFIDFSKRCAVFFDVGASDGYYSLLFRKYNASGTLYLFDGNEGFKEIQSAHFALNNIRDGYQQFFKFVSNTDDELQISLDSFEIKNNTVLIKVDVEGRELMVLQGAAQLLKNNNCFMLIETHSAQLEKDCISFLNKEGYAARIIKNAWWRSILPERRPLVHNRWLAGWRRDN